MVILQHVAHVHGNKDLLFDNINLTISKHSKAALIGNNGAGKSTLLKIIAGILPASGSTVETTSKPYYVPQIFGQFNHLTIATVLGVETKLHALHEILSGNVTESNLELLNDDWPVEERCLAALAEWGLKDLDLRRKMESLSGGQKTKVFLAGIAVHHPEIILLDEPTNHLDAEGRKLLFDFIQSTQSTLVVVSHDRKLLNQLNPVYELSKKGITVYGGNYEFYAEQKLIEGHALEQDIRNKAKTLRKAKETEQETAERKQKLDARGKRKQEKAGAPRIAMNTLRNNAEKSTARLKSDHIEKVKAISEELNELRHALPGTDKMKLNFDHSGLHRGKILFAAENINHEYGTKPLWRQPLNLTVSSGERIAVKGANGSGKTTLIRMFLGELQPQSGSLKRAANKAVYIDQDYSLVKDNNTVYEQAQQFNPTFLPEHEIKIRLNRFLFAKDDWEKHCSVLSGGEKMRLALCCLSLLTNAPDVIILDEPTNNLDIQNIEILTAAVSDYRGTLIVISHDELFMEQLNVERTINLD